MTLLSDPPQAILSVPFARELADHGSRIALITPDERLSYRDLATRVATVAARLGTRRRLVLLAGANRVDAVVTYLAALAARHPVLLAPGDNPDAIESLSSAYRPDVVASAAGGTWCLDERHPGSAHDLHPDLALLLSTSGSTGSPKLVRLSHANVQSNAEAIAAYLGIRESDRAITSLPMHYCYGLSVLHSHFSRGAAVILTERSVTDPGFWDLFRAESATALAGVPYTFDLLDQAGFADMPLPSLRYVTQAGGRLAPERVRRYAELGQRRGWDLFVMYGQTEATARMAYLPPELAVDHPDLIGLPIPGGSFRLEPLTGADGRDPEVGELVYRGPNVMLGYAESPADLRLGRTLTELRTGDLARRHPGGLYEIVGRRSRFVKLFGLRIDPQRIEKLLEGRGLVAGCTGGDDRLVVAVERGGTGTHDTSDLQRLVAGACGLPDRVIGVRLVDRLPRLATGKVDYPAVAALAAKPVPGEAEAADLRALYASVLCRTGVTDDSTFVDLGGDSLSYVEMVVRLERALGGPPPAGWPTTPIRELRAAARPDPRRGTPVRRALAGARLDTSVALRAIAIVLIAGSHIQVFALPGGAHTLIGVAGFNFARFHLTGAERRDRVRHLGRSLARIVLAAMTWIGAMYLLTDDYSLASVFLANYLVGPDDPGLYGWHFWFIEALVYFLLILLAAISLPAVDRLERRLPFALPMGLAALGLISRYQLVPGVILATPVVVFWLFALGWAAAKAESTWQRGYVTAAILLTVPGFFDNPAREAIVVTGLTLLVWVPHVPSVRLLNRAAAALAAASMYIYLTHWQVFRPIDDRSRVLALLACLAFGVAYAMVVPRLARKALTAFRGTSEVVQRLDRKTEAALN